MVLTSASSRVSRANSIGDLSEMQVSSPPCPDEEKEHLTDGEAPSPMESVSESSSSAQVTLRVTIDMDPNAQLYVYHLRLKPSAASYVGALVMMDRATFFAAAAPYRSGSPAETAGIVSSSWIEVYGPPSAIITERAPAFAADLQASMNLIADVRGSQEANLFADSWRVLGATDVQSHQSTQ